MIDKIIYINLKERTDRRRHIEAQLNSFGVEYERFEAVKPSLSDLVPEGGKYHRFYEKSQIRQARYSIYDFLNLERVEFGGPDFRKYLLGTMGCYLSHYKIHQMAQANNWGNYLILEDDVKMKEESIPELEQAINRGWFGEDWDIIRSSWLSNGEMGLKYDYSHPVSSSYTEKCEEKIRKKVKFYMDYYLPQQIREFSAYVSAVYGGTHFQLIKGSSSGKILNYLDSEVVIPIDALYSTHRLQSYEFRSKVLRERSFDSDIHPTH